MNSYELLLERLRTIPQSFDPSDFMSYSKFSDRVQYCDATLTKIGSGSSRIVYKLDDNKALKIAKNRKGIAQNEQEYSAYCDGYSCLAKVYSADDDNFYWIISELASKAKPSDFNNLWGISFDEVKLIIIATHDQYSHARNSLLHGGDKELADHLMEEYVYSEKIPELYDLYNYLHDFTPSNIYDLCYIRNWGKVNRNGNEELVIVDNGLSDEVFDNFYTPRR